MSERLVWERGERIWYPLITHELNKLTRYEQAVCPECGKALVCIPRPFETTMLPFEFAHEAGNEGLLDPSFTKKGYMSISGWGIMKPDVMIDPVAVWKDEHGRQFADEYHHPEHRYTQPIEG